MTTRTGSAPLAVCTIISHNYLSHARTLVQSVLQQEPDAHTYVLVVDRLPEGVEFGFNVRVIDPAELRFENWDELCFQYDAMELCTAVKPRLLSLLLDEYGESQLVYLDPDILVLRPLTALQVALTTASIVLTPHILKPIPADNLRPSEHDILITGAYNLGFLAIRQSNQSNTFLEWWDRHLQTDCRVDISRGLFVDQKWMDLAPGFFDGTTILRDETYNVAFWNLQERILDFRENGFNVNEQPLTFYHFSGFDPSQPRLLSKYQTRTPIVENSALAALIDRYVTLQMENGYETFIRLGYGYGSFDNGMTINPLLRQIYLDTSSEQRAQFGNPFQTGQAHSFLEWASSLQAEAQISPLLQEFYIMHPEIITRFPDVLGKDKKPFTKWALGICSQEKSDALAPMPLAPLVTRVPRARHGANHSAPPSRDIYEGMGAPLAKENRSLLKAMWERKRTVHALEKWAKEMEVALMETEKYIQVLEQTMSFLDSSPFRAARWIRRKLNRKPFDARKN